MDLDKGLVAAILREGILGLTRARDKLYNEDLLVGEGRSAYDYIIDFHSNYGAVPEERLIIEKTGVDLDPDPIGKGEPYKGPVDWWLDQILARRLSKQLRECSKDLIANLDGDKPLEALDAVEKALQGIRKEQQVTNASIQTLGTLGGEVWDYYQAVKAGKRGILTPWDSMNEATFGFWPSDLAVFVARVGIGKTWTAVLLALHAWKNGHKVLFGTTEISRVRIAMRLIAAHYKLCYDHLRKGKLGSFAEARLEHGLKEILDDQNFYVAGGNFDFRVESFASSLIDIAPELTILDGAYLLRVEGKTRTERAANAFDELKRIANGQEIPTVVTMQFNRGVKANVASSVDIGNIALTDVAAWNADLGYALIQTDDMKAAKTMTFKPLKVREGVGETFDVTWDLDTMNFPEVPRGTSGGGDADEGFGTDAERVEGIGDPNDAPF